MNMLNETQFHKNIELWSRVDPKHALRLQYVDASHLKFCHTQKGELNLETKFEGQPCTYHDSLDAAKEAEEWFAALELRKVPVLVVYGVGLGYYYDAAQAWLKKDRKHRLIFLEDDLPLMVRFLETEHAQILLQDPQVQVLYFQDLKDHEGVFEVLYWNFAMSPMIITALGFYAKTKNDLFSKLRHKIAYDNAVKNALVEEYLRFGGAFFINFYQNMLSLPGSYLGNKSFGAFRHVPAIICGAGPSLEKNLALLGTLQDKALIFAGGSALNALNAAGIQPHLGAGIDPNPAQFERLSNNTAYEVPFYYRNRMHHDAFEMIHGPRLYITGCGGYDVSEFFEEKFKINQEFLDEGHNVVNFCLQIAHQLGCNPIIFVGMDLAFTGMKSYAPGVEDNVEFDPNKALDVEDFDSVPLLLKDIHGNPLYTLWKWVAESDWIGEFAKDHPQATIRNCTEGGLGFPGVPNETLKEVAEQYLNRNYALRDRLNGEIQNCAIPSVTLPKVKKLLNELKASLQRCIEDFDFLFKEAEAALEIIKNEKRLPSIQSGRGALIETELAEEAGYIYILDIFNAVQARLLNRELQEAKYASDLQKAANKLEINLKRFSFLRDVAKVNVRLIDFALERRKSNQSRRKPSTLSIKHEKKPFEIQQREFAAAMLPENAKEGQTLKSGHRVRILRQYGQGPEEVRLEKDGKLDGQCLLYYPSGKLKSETFYRSGELHGPFTFYAENGQVLSKSWFEKGKKEGECLWFYNTGALYAIQQFCEGVPHGKQEFFYENGVLKTSMHYKKGKLEGIVYLYDPKGKLKREIAFPSR